MGYNRVDGKPHAVCIPYPAQGHINPMLKLAKVLHQKGFFITFVNTEFNRKRLLKSRGSNSLDGLPDFKFESIPDGMPSSDPDATQDIRSLCESILKNCLAPFCSLLSKLNDAAPDVPPVTCIVADGSMTFTLQAAEQFGLPVFLFLTVCACAFLSYTQYSNLVEKGYIPLKDISYLTNGYLETTLDWIPGMKDIRLRDFPSFIRTTDSNDFMLNFVIKSLAGVPKSTGLILNTFDGLEQDAINAISAIFPRVYSIGPLQLMLNEIKVGENLKSIGSNLWEEEQGCIEWLNDKDPNSVVYVNFGSITVMSAHQLIEFAWGLANSMRPFLWIVRPDLVSGDRAILPLEFVMETKERGLLASWCPQEEVLNHHAVGGFLTHSGWNSTLESIESGVPLICWPFFADQQTNCRYSCKEWEIGMEIDNDVKRDEVEILVRELMEGEKGMKMRKKAMEWKKMAEEAVGRGGSSYKHLDKLLKEVLLIDNL